MSIQRETVEAVPEAPCDRKTLDPVDWDEFAAFGHRLIDDMTEHLRTIGERPVWQSMPPAVRERLDAPLPRAGAGRDAAYAEFLRDVLPYSVGNVHPRFWGWVIGTGSPSGMLYEMLTAAMNTNLVGFDQSAADVERQVVAWLVEMLGLPATTHGVLTTGTSTSTLVGLAVARHDRIGHDVRRLGLGPGAGRYTIYASAETHVSVTRAVEILGFGSQALRHVAVDADYRIDLAALRDSIRTDRMEGRAPLAIVGNAGSVKTGSVDDLSALADLAEEEGLVGHGRSGRMADGRTARGTVRDSGGRRDRVPDQ